MVTKHFKLIFNPVFASDVGSSCTECSVQTVTCFTAVAAVEAFTDRVYCVGGIIEVIKCFDSGKTWNRRKRRN